MAAAFLPHALQRPPFTDPIENYQFAAYCPVTPQPSPSQALAGFWDRIPVHKQLEGWRGRRN